MDIFTVLGSTVGIGFLSGFRLYATVLAIGLAVRFHVFTLSQEMSTLSILADTKVLIAAGAICVIEFLADKIPWVDSAWDSVHTVIRPLAAVALAGAALGDMDPILKTVLALVSGSVALGTHSAKAATRLAVNHSPEPFSNVALSLAEDVAAPLGLWVVLQHPVVALGLVSAFGLLFAVLAPRIYRALKFELAAIRGVLVSWFGEPGGDVDCVYGAAAKSVPELRRSVGWVRFDRSGAVVFETRRSFRDRRYEIAASDVRGIQWRKGLFVDELLIDTPRGEVKFDVFKSASPRPLAHSIPQAAG